VNKNYVPFAVVSFLVLVLLTSTSSACIGMDAAKIHLNVSAGQSATGSMTIFNNCDTPINFETGADIQPVTNQTTPTVDVSPGSGVLTGHQQLTISITISMPANATPGTQWIGGAAAMQISNSSRGGGANLQVGVRTTITVTALAPPPINYLNYLLPAIAVIIVVLIIYFILRKKKTAKGEKKTAKNEKKPAAVKKNKPAKRRKK
jgi:hypothetical protein